MLLLRNSLLILFLVIYSIGFSNGQYYETSYNEVKTLKWCAKTLPEFYKCGNFSNAIERDRALFDEEFLNLTCLRAYSVEECIRHVDRDEAQITTLDAGDLFTAGRYHSLIPILQTRYQSGFTNYYSVAVIKAGDIPELRSMHDFRNKKICFPWVGSLAGWVIPIYSLQHEGGMDVLDCNNQVKTAANYFNMSCAVNSLIDKYNPIGDNSDKLCSLCTGKVGDGKCTPTDPYYGYDGAFRCLMEAGDVAFLKHTTVDEMISGDEFKSVSADRFQLICKDGSRRPIADYRQCSWGIVPSDAVVTSSAHHIKKRKIFQRFLQRAVELYAAPSNNLSDVNNPNRFGSNDNRNFYDPNNPNNGLNQNRFNNQYDNNRNRYDNNQNRYDNNQNRYDNNQDRFGRIDSSFSTTDRSINSNDTQFYEKFEVFSSQRYGKKNLMFEDTAISLTSINEEVQSFSAYLKDSTDYIYGIRRCPVGRMTLCVTSDVEQEKCIKMRTALNAQIVKPELICYKAHSHINCMQAISSGVADVAVFDAGDVYTAGLTYQMVPFMAEVYDLGLPEYYVVALARESDPTTELTYLRNKKTCHTGINTAAGWTYPLAHLIANGWMRPYGCNSIRAAAEYFAKSCVPGAISSEYNTGVPYDNMCDLCRGSSYRYCRRDASEDFYGNTGAFRCLVEGGGDVAFVKHTTVHENTGGKRKEFWARDTLVEDFELLCLDGTRKELSDYETCNLGRVKANAIVTRGGPAYNETELNAYINLLLYAQQLYGRIDADEFSFSMFSSPSPYHDLIFQDATRQLMVIEPDKRRFDLYLGKNFMRARRITDCHAASSFVQANILVIFFVTISMSLLNRVHSN